MLEFSSLHPQPAHQLFLGTFRELVHHYTQSGGKTFRLRLLLHIYQEHGCWNSSAYVALAAWYLSQDAPACSITRSRSVRCRFVHAWDTSRAQRLQTAGTASFIEDISIRSANTHFNLWKATGAQPVLVCDSVQCAAACLYPQALEFCSRLHIVSC